MNKEINTSNTNSFDSNRHKLNTDAPSTLRTLISLIRCSATKIESPNNPRQLIKIARIAKKEASLPTLSSAANFAA